MPEGHGINISNVFPEFRRDSPKQTVAYKQTDNIHTPLPPTHTHADTHARERACVFADSATTY
jgi:hypothetical protein